AWEEPSAPPMLGMPSQHLLTAEAEERIHRHRRADLTTIPVGQIVGQMNQVRPAAEIIGALVADCEAAIGRAAQLLQTARKPQPSACQTAPARFRRAGAVRAARPCSPS